MGAADAAGSGGGVECFWVVRWRRGGGEYDAEVEQAV